MRLKLRLISYKWGYNLACVWHFVFSAVWNFLENNLEISYIEATSKAISKAKFWIGNLSSHLFNSMPAFSRTKTDIEATSLNPQGKSRPPSNTDGYYQTNSINTA